MFIYLRLYSVTFPLRTPSWLLQEMMRRWGCVTWEQRRGSVNSLHMKPGTSPHKYKTSPAFCLYRVCPQVYAACCIHRLLVNEYKTGNLCFQSKSCRLLQHRWVLCPGHGFKWRIHQNVETPNWRGDYLLVNTSYFVCIKIHWWL